MGGLRVEKGGDDRQSGTVGNGFGIRVDIYSGIWVGFVSLGGGDDVSGGFVLGYL